MLLKSLLGFLLFSAGGAHAADISLYCHVPTTIFAVFTGADGKITSTVTHPHGIQFTPLYKGTVVAEQVGKLARSASILANFGASQSFVWPKESCRMTKPMVFACSQGEPVIIDGHEVHPVSIVTTVSSHELADFSYENFNINITFRIGSQMFNLTSDYRLQDCQ